MHRGRPYPRHPTYWATEAWFWPGYVPWKLRWVMGINADQPWSFIPALTAGVSLAGYHDAKPLVIAYDIPVYGGSPGTDLRVLLDRIGDEQEGYSARWRVQYLQGGVVLSEGFAFQEYPQREVLIAHFDYSEPQPPYTSEVGPNITLRPATYAEGGSPYD